MGASTGSGGGFVAEINVTPFVDVMLVLLIIFMVTAPMMTEGLDVALPQTKTVQVLPEDDGSVVLTVRADGALFVDDYRTDMDGMGRLLATRAAERPTAVFLRADRDVPYGTVVEVIGLVRAAGVEKVGMVSEREGHGPQARS
ncbi:ExbD/TolR family protein [Nitratidesulfovibrio sp. D1]|uniref:ExbD/TolR family protein n=1 Tax=Nitratidesulfovibrio sp. D1 TaxID=3440151 RepID=UPI003EB81957